jgi:hypothetical protein
VGVFSEIKAFLLEIRPKFDPEKYAEFLADVAVQHNPACFVLRE